jgi:hypothetical protein
MKPDRPILDSLAAPRPDLRPPHAEASFSEVLVFAYEAWLQNPSIGYPQLAESIARVKAFEAAEAAANPPP